MWMCITYTHNPFLIAQTDTRRFIQISCTPHHCAPLRGFLFWLNGAFSRLHVCRSRNVVDPHGTLVVIEKRDGTLQKSGRIPAALSKARESSRVVHRYDADVHPGTRTYLAAGRDFTFPIEWVASHKKTMYHI